MLFLYLCRDKFSKAIRYMLGRRQIREKVMQSLYALENSDNQERVVEKNLFKSIDSIYDLYIMLLHLTQFMKTIAENKVELAKNKRLATEEDLNPNLKFVENKILHILSINKEMKDYLEKNSQLHWSLLDSEPTAIYNKIKQTDAYAKYMSNRKNTFSEDKELIMNLFEEVIAPDEQLWEYVEEQNLSWADDISIANSMVINTLKSFVPSCNEGTQLFSVFKNDEDRSFAQELFRKTLRYGDETRQMIEKRTQNWDIDRIAQLDLIILRMACTEFLYFRTIPERVTINEYIELAKHYSTEKSRLFVNGVLDRIQKELAAAND